jgi:hypothetical protein
MRIYKRHKIKYVIDTEWYLNTLKLHSWYKNEWKTSSVGVKVFTILPSLYLTFPYWRGITHDSNTVCVICSFLTFWFKLSIYYKFTPIQKLEDGKTIDYSNTIDI